MPNGLPLVPFEWHYCATCGTPLVDEHDGESVRPYCPPCNRFFYRNPVPACCLFIRDEKNRLLFGRRNVEPCLGKWALPGGFMELLENGEQCAVREMLEETGLEGSGPVLLGAHSSRSTDKGSVLVLGYVITAWSGDLSPSSDVSELCFFSRDERPDIPFDAHRSLLALYDTLYP
ncbi:MAG TPA: NUDIX hydrolase [Candidatus Hydrogenedentes bacterium]|jgi:ADP-ribose pyrophosphatase YjhB (NUDIX family)|nr:MAG: NADH pyrophosphatase [Candidatus Hydrogenedentes bacterium ADurb.Bin170]HOD95668.1 NUDIX hydrolase [Candidatus Hydrogenedentota bacterium]HOM47531.1 NUDIX hydrolase [Candidatus Hydrogenedentota bacterium]HOR50639.1 NUDIX hydrolase [Candidatus Hydrogenedentota bacterium]HPK23719.1 NUDIX hydrolase [Candidatus Hydrogenedentota bacterium]